MAVLGPKTVDFRGREGQSFKKARVQEQNLKNFPRPRTGTKVFEFEEILEYDSIENRNTWSEIDVSSYPLLFQQSDASFWNTCVRHVPMFLGWDFFDHNTEVALLVLPINKVMKKANENLVQFVVPNLFCSIPPLLIKIFFPPLI